MNISEYKRTMQMYVVHVFLSHTHLGEQLQSEGTKSACCYS